MRGRSAVLRMLAATLASLALATGCTSDKTGEGATQTASQAPSRLVDLNAIDNLRTAFNAKPDMPRLILLLSPT